MSASTRSQPWLGLAIAALLVWTGASRAAAAPRDAQPSYATSCQQSFPTWLRAASLLPDLRHRGDWERDDALVLVHHYEWARPIARLARIAARWTRVFMLIESDDLDPPRFVPHSGPRRIRVLRQGTDSPWVRDYGPIQVFDHGHPRWLDFAYADDRQRDDRVPSALASHFEMPLQRERQRFDGGGIASNGRGLCAVTDASLIEAGFAPGDPVLPLFAARLGCKVMSILPALPGESTGHVDIFVQFFGPHVVGVGQMHESWEPEQVAALDASVRALERAAAAIGQPLRIVRIPIVAGQDAFYTYINGIAVGDVFFMPTYSHVGSETQALARRQLRATMPTRRIVDIRADEMIAYGGALHCITSGLSLRRTYIRDTPPRWSTLGLWKPRTLP